MKYIFVIILLSLFVLTACNVCPNRTDDRGFLTSEQVIRMKIQIIEKSKTTTLTECYDYCTNIKWDSGLGDTCWIESGCVDICSRGVK